MVDLKNMNNNIISRRWKERYAELSEDKKNKIVRLDNSKPSEYQLRVIKRKRTYPDIGDLFMIKPNEELTLYGAVVNNHINSIMDKDNFIIFPEYDDGKTGLQIPFSLAIYKNNLLDAIDSYAQKNGID